jgi:DNA-binding NarL/FixJ family response regulator
MPSQGGDRIRVFLVDDTDLVRQSLERILRSEADIEVVGQAATIGEMSVALGSDGVDVVLMDYWLPDGDGISAAQQLRQDRPETRVLILTGWGPDTDMAARAKEAGCAGILPKSLDIHNSLAGYVRRAHAGEFTTSNTEPLLP